MPKGKPLPNMMDNEVVEVLHTCLTHSDNANIDFGAVARDLGLKDGATAKSRLARVMKAQIKGNAAVASTGSTPSKITKTKAGKMKKPTANETKNSDYGKKIKVEGGGAEDFDGVGDAKIKTESEGDSSGVDEKVKAKSNDDAPDNCDGADNED